jgi:4-amino-4-deoxy-L-arabinose transferase-like glycosyltransferase
MTDLMIPIAANIKPILTGILVLVLSGCIINRWSQVGQLGSTRRLDLLAGGLLVAYAILLLALGLRHQGLTDYSVEWDYSGYALRAQNLAGVFSINPRTPFGYPLVLWAVTLLTGDLFVSGKVLAGLSTLAVLALAYLLAKRLFNPYVALLAILALLVTPVFAEHAMLVATDMPAMACLLASIYVLIASGGHSWWRVAMAGILGGMSYLVRPSGLVLVPAVLLWLLGLRWAHESAWIHHRFRTALAYSLGFGFAILPHLLLNTIHTGNPFYNNRAMDIWLDMYGNWDWTLVPQLTDVTLAEVIRVDPWYFVVHWGENLLETLKTFPLAWPIAVFAVPGVLALPFHSRRVEMGLIYCFGISFLVLVSPGWSAAKLPRIFMPLVPFLLMIAVWLFCHLNPLDLRVSRLRLPWREPLFLTGLLIMLWSQTYYSSFLQPGSERLHSFVFPAIPNRLDLDLEGKAHLLGYAVAPRELPPGGRVGLTLYWRAGFVGDKNYTVFVHVIDGDGRMWAGQDNWPQNNEFPTSLWMAGEFITDVYEIGLPSDIPPGEYQIEVGMYLLETMERLQIHGEGGEPQGTSIVFPGFRIEAHATP